MAHRIARYAFIAALAALVLPAAAGAGAMRTPVTIGHSGWNWGNPVPQGNTLNAVEFGGTRGYAAGNFGTVLRTDNGGLDYTGVATGITLDLLRIRALDENTVIVGAGCLLRRSDDGGQTFRRLPFVPSEQRCPAGVSSFHFPSKDVGYLALSDGTVLRTANGGTSFSRRTAIPGSAATGSGATVPNDQFFTGLDTGVAVVSSGQIYRTTDGGGTWTQVKDGGPPLNSVTFVDAMNGYAVGDGNSVFKSTDGGLTWTQRTVPGDVPASDFNYIRCANANLCIIATKGGERIVRTPDGGTSFTAITPSTQKIFAVAFLTATNVVGVGEAGATVVSADGGQTYTTVGTRLSGTYNRIRATSQQLVYAMGDNGQLARTVDGGDSWTTVGVATSEDLRDASFATQQVGYALDVAGSALRTDDEGASWSILDTGTTAAPNAIYALNANKAFLVGPTGLRITSDGGATPFEPVTAGALRRAALSDYDTAAGALFVWGPRALVASRNDGSSWTAVRRPGGRRDRIADVDFISARVGFVLLANGRLYTTRNGGRRWSELPATGNEQVLDIAFNSARDGFISVEVSDATVEDGYVLRTSDGGRSWRPQLISRTSLEGIVAPAESNAYALETPSTFFTTKTNGDLGTISELTINTRTRRINRSRVVTITGKLDPGQGSTAAIGGTQVVVSMRRAGGTSWSEKTATVSSSGTFTLTFRVSATSYFVAQWDGDADRNGDGSAVLTVTRR